MSYEEKAREALTADHARLLHDIRGREAILIQMRTVLSAASHAPTPFMIKTIEAAAVTLASLQMQAQVIAETLAVCEESQGR